MVGLHGCRRFPFVVYNRCMLDGWVVCDGEKGMFSCENHAIKVSCIYRKVAGALQGSKDITLNSYRRSGVANVFLALVHWNVPIPGTEIKGGKILSC